jgi:hypothetical protein
LNTKFINEIYRDIDGLVEVREIDKPGEVEQKFLTLEQLQEYQIPMDKNIYYGVYSRIGRNGTAKGCKTTGALWTDYDNMDISKVKSNIEGAGIPTPSIYVNSGHGIHAYWLLDSRANETTDILKSLAVTTGADTRATDKARVMRLPSSMNVKGDPLKCEVIEGTYKRYSIESFKQILNIQEKAINETASTVNEIPGIKIPISELLNANRPCIKNMANGVKEGHRNFAEGRLIKYLQVKGKTNEVTREIIKKWNLNNEPQEEIGKLLRDFETYWRQDYKLLGCTIGNKELQSILYDYCDKGTCRLNANIGSLKLNNNTKYNNRIFNFISKLTGKDLIVLGVLNKHTEGLTTSILIKKLTARATKKCCIDIRTLRNTLILLESHNLINCVKGNQRVGGENLYKAIPQGTYGLGYTICSNGAINGAIDGRVKPSEFKLYVLLLKYAFQKGSCYPSQITLAKELGITQQAVNGLLKELEDDKVDYIKKNTQYLNGVESLVYTLLV